VAGTRSSTTSPRSICSIRGSGASGSRSATTAPGAGTRSPKRARVGNVYDYLAGGGLLRLGRNLRVDYGPPHVDLNNGSDYINPDRADVEGVGFYVFLGAEWRAVARNIFLDGNSFKASASVDKLPLVGDLQSGLAGTWGHWRLAYTYVYRSQEFIHQSAPDHYGSLDLTFRASF
jgi:hypothetical protein